MQSKHIFILADKSVCLSPISHVMIQWLRRNLIQPPHAQQRLISLFTKNTNGLFYVISDHSLQQCPIYQMRLQQLFSEMYHLETSTTVLKPYPVHRLAEHLKETEAALVSLLVYFAATYGKPIQSSQGTNPQIRLLKTISIRKDIFLERYAYLTEQESADFFVECVRAFYPLRDCGFTYHCLERTLEYYVRAFMPYFSRIIPQFSHPFSPNLTILQVLLDKFLTRLNKLSKAIPIPEDAHQWDLNALQKYRGALLLDLQMNACPDLCLKTARVLSALITSNLIPKKNPQKENSALQLFFDLLLPPDPKNLFKKTS